MLNPGMPSLLLSADDWGRGRVVGLWAGSVRMGFAKQNGVC